MSHFNKDKKEFFNTLADRWDKTFYNDKLESRLSEIVSMMNLKEGSLILEVGAGTGNLIPHLIKAINSRWHIYAIDYAEEMISCAKKKYKAIQNVTFDVADAANLPYIDELFDYVICFGSFPHFDDKPKALKEIARVLVKGGRLFIAHALSSEEIKHHHSRCLPVANDQLPEKEEMQILLEKAGINIIRYIDKEGLYLCEGEKI